MWENGNISCHQGKILVEATREKIVVVNQIFPSYRMEKVKKVERNKELEHG